MSDSLVPQANALPTPENVAIPAPQFQVPDTQGDALPKPDAPQAISTDTAKKLAHFASLPEAPAPQPKRLLTQKQKAAVIVRLMLKEGIELNLDELPEALQLELIHEMGALQTIDKATMDAVVHEFVAELVDIGTDFPKGVEGALDVLDTAFSPDTMQRLRLQTGIVVQGDPWETVESLDDAALAHILMQESTETAAIVLSKLSVPKSAAVLALLPGDRARAVTFAVSTTSAIDPETVRTIGHAIATEISKTDAKAFEVEPDRRVGEILNQAKSQTREELLDGLVEEDEGFGKAVRKVIFTFEDIPARIDPPDVAKLTRAVDQETFARALAYASSGDDSKATVDFIFDNIAKRMGSQIREDMGALGNVPEDDGEAAISAIITAIKDLEQAGEIKLAAIEV